MAEMRIDKFFSPSPSLIEQIVRRLNEKHLDRLTSLLDSNSPRDEAAEERGNSSGLLQAALSTLRNTDERSEQDIHHDQRWLGEILYHYLARLANSARAKEGEEFATTDYITRGMSSRLGLKQEADVALLNMLADEFRGWLGQRERYTFIAGWGEIVGSSENAESFLLKKFERPPKAVKAAAGTGSSARAVAVGQSFSQGKEAQNARSRSTPAKRGGLAKALAAAGRRVMRRGG